MLEKYEVCRGLFHGFDWSPWIDGHAAGAPRRCCPRRRSTSSRRRTARPGCCAPCTELSQAFALAVPHDEALRIRDDVGFFQAVRAVLAKSAPGERKTDEELDHAIRQIISQGGRLRTRSSTSSPRPA